MPHTTTRPPCGPIPEVVQVRISSRKVSGQDTYYLTQESKLWPIRSTISYSFYGGSDPQQSAVHAAIVEYARYANISFVHLNNRNEHANIRITFEGLQSWSAIGTDALKLEPGECTMNLGIIDKPIPSDEDQAVILHEVGHVLGLGHEWDGENFQASGHHDEAFHQHMSAQGQRIVSNFPEYDGDSIMNYFVPFNLAADKKTIPVNQRLSDKDKAWLTINYPGKAPEVDGQRWTVLHAVVALNIPSNIASALLGSRKASEKREIYSAYVASLWGEQFVAQSTTRSLIQDQLLQHFANLEKPRQDFAAKGQLSNPGSLFTMPLSNDTGVNGTSSSQDDGSGIDPLVYDVFASAVIDPRFQEAVANIAVADLRSRGLLSSAPVHTSADIQQGIFSVLIPLITQIVGGVISNVPGQNSIQANGIQATGSTELPPEVQQGIFDVVTSFMKNPIFINVVKEIVKTVV